MLFQLWRHQQETVNLQFSAGCCSTTLTAAAAPSISLPEVYIMHTELLLRDSQCCCCSLFAPCQLISNPSIHQHPQLSVHQHPDRNRGTIGCRNEWSHGWDTAQICGESGPNGESASLSFACWPAVGMNSISLTSYLPHCCTEQGYKEQLASFKKINPCVRRNCA